MPLLSPGDTFPTITLTTEGDEQLVVPDFVEGGFGVVLFFRGSWCPYCNAQLRAFQRAQDALSGVGARVVALSVDDQATTRELIAKHGLTFPVGRSADAHAIADATGAFVNHDPVFIQSTGFILDPAGKVMISVYSSGDRTPGARGRHRHDPLSARARRECVGMSAAPQTKDAATTASPARDGHAPAPDYPAMIAAINHIEPVPRRVRAMLAGAVVVDTVAALRVGVAELPTVLHSTGGRGCRSPPR